MSKELDDFVEATRHLDIRLGETITERSERLCRARAIRAVVAAQWAVACALMLPWESRNDRTGETDYDRGWDEGYAVACEARAEDVAALPTPEAIVDGAA